MYVGTVKESFPGERRVALTPGVVSALAKVGVDVLVEAGAGIAAGFDDAAYRDAGATIAENRDAVFAQADVVCQVRTLGANPQSGRDDLPRMRHGQTILGLAEPFTDAEPLLALAKQGVRTIAMELMPRITRAQTMDVLSSQSTISGYKAALLAAEELPRMFPMMMTAAGTLAPAKAFVIGAGVAGLQAIATSKRLGAVVLGYDIRAAVREQVESLGAKFLEIEIEAEAGGSEDKGGYAKAKDEAFYRRQQEAMHGAVADNDVVITTAAVPGRKSPELVTEEMVLAMSAGSVIVDLAAERGGNCAMTVADERVVTENGVTILGPTNLPATVPYHASQMFARNVTALLQHLVSDGQLQFNQEDEIASQTLVTEGGEIVQPRVREILGLDVPAAVTGGSDSGDDAGGGEERRDDG